MCSIFKKKLIVQEIIADLGGNTAKMDKSAKDSTVVDLGFWLILDMVPT